MKKSTILMSILIFFMGITLLKVPIHASEEGHTTISGQSTEYTGGKTDIIDNNVDTTLIDNSDGSELHSSFFLQSYWFNKIPDDILPQKIKGYAIKAVNSYTIFAALILVILLASMAYSSLDEQQLRMSVKAVKILLTSIIVMNLLAPIIHLGLWIAGAL
ncbi:MAG: hypothetical protein J6I68_14665 [Butyrivibrio sp.]|uniref:hypothetical protein n=1 Tax=Butyrivibrio sp. TaxID=28121 RepID=UPI001B7B2C87|nr:hypothetical protein [Butyrivibrio sp.]MBP3784485.1 hypothetical protein [Butyrivibrio sp.]